MRTWLHKPLLLGVIGGVSVFLAMIFPIVWPLGIIGVTCYFLSIRACPSWRSTLLPSALFGLLASAGGVWWFWNTIPLSWISIPDGPVQYFLVGMVFSLTVLSLALPFIVAAPLIRIVRAAWYAPFLMGAIYLAVEELRMWCFALFFLGPESMVAPDFSIANLGYLLTENPLTLPLAQAGVSGLALFVGVLAATIVIALQRMSTATCSAVALTVTLLVSHLILPPLPNGASTRIALIATNFAAGHVTMPEPILDSMRAAGKTGATVIVTPEGLGLRPFYPADERKQLYRSFFSGKEGLVISSSVVKEGSNERAELIYESSEHGIIARQDKMFFVPVGEYLPPLLRLAISFAGKESLHGYGEYIDGTVLKGSALSAVTFNDVRIGALLCSEMLSPRLYRDMNHEQATNILVNVANNSWFHGSHLLHARLKQLAKTHALQNHQPMLVAANGSPAYAVDAHGELIGETAWGEDTLLILDIPR